MGTPALFLLVFTEVHPCAERSLALAIAFIQIQIAVWVISLTRLQHPLMEICVNRAAVPLQK